MDPGDPARPPRAHPSLAGQRLLTSRLAARAASPHRVLHVAVPAFRRLQYGAIVIIGDTKF